MQADFSNGDFNPALPESRQRALEVLEQGAIVDEIGMLRWSSNYAFLVKIEHDGTRLTTVYKPQKGERPLWDFPDGTLCLREKASFLTSQELGWDIVPPTVLREGAHGFGSFQFFVDHNPEQTYFTFDESLKPRLRVIAAFDHLVNNADRKGGHCLLDPFGHLWGIDHGITFHVSNKLRTVIWDFAGDPIPDELLADIESLCAALEDVENPYRVQMASLLAKNELNAFQMRVRRLLRDRKFPQPGSGPNYPWPPV